MPVAARLQRPCGASSRWFISLDDGTRRAERVSKPMTRICETSGAVWPYLNDRRPTGVTKHNRAR